jgi:biotin operon repressor
MSIQAVAWVLEHSQAKLADRLVLIAIANHADARGWNAWPSIEKIAEEAGIHEVTVWRSVKALEELGELVAQRRPGRPNRYRLPALDPLQSAMGKGLQDARGGPPANRKEPLANRKKPLNRMQGEPLEPSRTVAGARATEGHPALPPDLPDDVKAKGAEFFRTLRRGGEA